MNASKFQNNLCNFLTFAYSGVKTYQQYLLNSIVNVIVQIFRYCLREHAIKVFATLSLCPDSTAVPRHGVDYQELLCPDRRAVAVRGKDVAGYEAATFDNSFYRRMSHDLEQFPGFIHPSCMILRPVPDAFPERRPRLMRNPLFHKILMHPFLLPLLHTKQDGPYSVLYTYQSFCIRGL